MSSTVQDLSQAERLQDVAVAGVGAEHPETSGHRIPEQARNGSVEALSEQSDGVVDPKGGAGSENQPPVPPQASERSKGKVALIMGSLSVRDTETEKKPAREPC